MFGGSGPHTKPTTHHRTWGSGYGSNSPIRLSSIKTPVRKLSSVVVSLDLVLGYQGADVVIGPAGSHWHPTSDGECRPSV